MNKTTTQDLIYYAYNETDLKNSDRIQRSIDGDPLVQNDFNDITETMSALDSGKVRPSEATLKRILDFAKSRS